MHPMDEEGVDDMATLAELHGGAIMHNLHQRYKRDQIYVSSTCIPLGKKKKYIPQAWVNVCLSSESTSCILRVSNLRETSSSGVLPN